jgi:hypothetical protein
VTGRLFTNAKWLVKKMDEQEVRRRQVIREATPTLIDRAFCSPKGEQREMHMRQRERAAEPAELV